MSAPSYSLFWIIGRGFGFLFGNWLRLAIISLPMVVVLVLIGHVMIWTAPEIVTAAAVEDIPQLSALLGGHAFLYGLFAIVPTVIWLSGLFRAYFDPSATAPYIWSGILPLRLLWAYIVLGFRFLLALLVVAIVVALVMGLLTVIGTYGFGESVNEALAGRANGTFVILANGAVILLGIGVIAYLVRFGMRASVLLPQTVHRQKVRFRDAWALTKGHVWKLFGAFLLGGLLFAVIMAVLLYVLYALISISGNEQLIWASETLLGNPPAAIPDKTLGTVLTASVLVHITYFISNSFTVGLLSAAYEAVLGGLSDTPEAADEPRKEGGADDAGDASSQSKPDGDADGGADGGGNGAQPTPTASPLIFGI